MDRTATSTAPAVGRRLPNLLVVGVKKAGTTSLFDYLGNHPDVCAGDRKAVNHFHASAAERPHDPVTLAGYAAHWRHWAGERWRLEAPTTYFYDGARIAPLLDATLPGARIVVSFRDPAQRLWSEFRKKQREDPARFAAMGFDEFVDHCIDAHVTGAGVTRPGYAGFARGLYADGVGPWLDRFGDRFRIVLMESWAADPAGQLGDLYAWLGIDTDVATGSVYGVRNQVHDLRSARSARAARGVWHRAVRLAPALGGLKPLAVSVHDRVNRRSPPRQRPPAGAIERLERAYAPANARLAAILRSRGVAQFPDWLRGTP